MASTRATGARRTTAAQRRAPIVIYVGTSADGTTFALDPTSSQRIREAFPSIRVSTRHVFIAHDTREDMKRTVSRLEDQIVILLTGLSVDRLSTRFDSISFRDPRSQREVVRLTAA